MLDIAGADGGGDEVTAFTRLLAGLLGLVVLTTSAAAQSLSATPSPLTPGATITVTAQSPTPPALGTDLCNSACYVLATYATVYVQGSNGFTQFADAYDGPAPFVAYGTQPGQMLTAYELYPKSGWRSACRGAAGASACPATTGSTTTGGTWRVSRRWGCRRR